MHHGIYLQLSFDGGSNSVHGWGGYSRLGEFTVEGGIFPGWNDLEWVDGIPFPWF